MPLNNKRCCTHAQNQTVSTTIEGQSRFLYDVVGGGCTRSCKPTRNPLPEVIAGHVIAADDDHAVNTSSIQPIFGHTKGGGCRSACQIDGGVRPADARVLGEL